MSRHPENAAKHCTSATLLRRHEAARSEQVNDAVNKILDALRSNGYEPALRSKMSRFTALSDNRSGHRWASLTNDEYQVRAAVFRPCSVSPEKMTEAKLGQYMVQHALDRGYEAVGVCREQSAAKLDAGPDVFNPGEHRAAWAQWRSAMSRSFCSARMASSLAWPPKALTT
jgi:hypothetical protein